MSPLTCQAVGCTAERKRWQFMCTAHWKRLPKPLRDQVNATWRAFQNRERGQEAAALILDYREATDEARRWTAEGEGKLAEFAPEADRFRKMLAAEDDE